jgi:hypothetical protein
VAGRFQARGLQMESLYLVHVELDVVGCVLLGLEVSVEGAEPEAVVEGFAAAAAG